MTPWNPRRQTRTAGFSVQGEADHPGTNGGASRTSDESPSIGPSTRELRGERVTLAGRGARLDALGHPHPSEACKPREIQATTLTVHGYGGAPSCGEC